MEENRKKKIIYSSLIVIIILLIISGITYSYFNAVSKDMNNVITTAKTELIVSVDEENTHIENLKPTTWNEEDIEENNSNKKIAQIPISVINKSNIDVKYYLRLLTEGLKLNEDVILEGGKLSDIKYVLYRLDTENSEVIRGDFENPEIEQIIVRRKDIKKDETQHYVLYVYIEETKELQNKLQGLSFDVIINGDIKTPKNYDKLEYIETTGTQWIATEIDYYNKAVEVTYSADDQYYEWGNVIIGTNDPTCVNYHVTLYSNAYYYGGGGGERRSGVANYGKIHTVKYNFNEGALIVDNSILDNTPINQKNGYNIYIGKRNHKEVPSKMKFYSVKIYDKDTEKLILDLIPVKDNNDVTCMYDLVNKEFYYNSGTGEFIDGPLK